MHIIGITGQKRHGKGETGEAIKSIALDRVETAKTVGFADKLKLAAARALGFHDLDTEAAVALMDEAKEKWLFSVVKVLDTPEYNPVGIWTMGDAVRGFTGRQYLQWFGTEVGRDLFGDTFWIDQVLPNPMRARSRALGTDVDEDTIIAYQAAHMHGNVDWLAITDIRFPNEAQRVLDCGGEVWRVVRDGMGQDGDVHASEIPLPDSVVTRTIHNNGTLSDLRRKVEKAMEAAA